MSKLQWSFSSTSGSAGVTDSYRYQEHRVRRGDVVAAWTIALFTMACIAIFDVLGDGSVPDPVAAVASPSTPVVHAAPGRQFIEARTSVPSRSATKRAVLHARSASGRVR